MTGVGVAEDEVVRDGRGGEALAVDGHVIPRQS